MYFISIKKKEIKIDPNNIFIYLFIFVKFSFNHSLDRQAKQPQQAVKVKSLLVHWTIGSTQVPLVELSTLRNGRWFQCTSRQRHDLHRADNVRYFNLGSQFTTYTVP